MIVVDASVLANVLADDGEDGRRARDRIGKESDLAAPDLVDVETVAVLRKRWLKGDLSERRFVSAIDDLEDVDLDRYPALPLMRRAFDLRANVSAYDASYIALAEGQERSPLRGLFEVQLPAGKPRRQLEVHVLQMDVVDPAVSQFRYLLRIAAPDREVAGVQAEPHLGTLQEAP